MATAKSPPASIRSRLSIRRLYRPLGFAKAFEFILFLVFPGFVMYFCLERLSHYAQYNYCVPEQPGAKKPTRPQLAAECYWFRRGLERFGYNIHVWAIVPAALLACLQLVPVMQRAKLIFFYRINGYAVLVMSTASTVGALIIGWRAMGGNLSFRIGNIFACAVFITDLVMAYISIRKLRVDLHREWMLRAWITAPFIITMRALYLILAFGISGPNSSYYTAMECKIIDHIVNGSHDRIMERQLLRSRQVLDKDSNERSMAIQHPELLDLKSGTQLN